MIFDSDVLIWFFRGNEKAKKIVREKRNLIPPELTPQQKSFVHVEEAVCTANGKHYKCLPDLKMSVFKVE